MTFKIGMSFRGYTRKPKGKEAAIISREVIQNVQEREMEELACLIGNEGYAFVPASMNGERKRQNFQSMQWFVLDFDSGVRFQEISRRSAENDLQMAFAYHTFSSQEKVERFRAVYIHIVPVTDSQAAEIMLDMMLRVFPEADKCCCDVSRMFFGGKGIICMEPGARFTFGDLMNAFMRVSDRGENLNRNIFNFARKHRIQMINGRLAAGHISDFPSYDGKWIPDNIIYIGENQIPSYFIVLYDTSHPVKTCVPKKSQAAIGDGKGCRLLDDFIRGKELGHHAKFALASNLRYLHGGRKFFLDKIRSIDGEEKYRKWKCDFKYMKGYHPKRCSPDFCEYFDTNRCAGTIYDTLLMDRKIYRISQERLYSMEEACGMLQENLNRAFLSGSTGIHLIKAQTALGKTRAYVKLVCENRQTRFIIACPTNMLKQEVARTVEFMGEKCFVTPSIQKNPMVPDETADLIASYHERGLHFMGQKILKESMEEIPEAYAAQKEEFQRIIDGLDGIRNERVIVTTHAFLLQMPEYFIKQHTVIIDEDILMLQMFTKISRVSTPVLEKAAQCAGKRIADIARAVLETPAGEYRKIQPQMNRRGLSEWELDALGAGDGENLNDLLAAESYVRREDGEVMYFCPQKLPEHKYILLSATLNEEIYRLYFSKTMPVFMYPEKKAAYTGRLKQYAFHLLGRADLEKKMEVFQTARDCIGKEHPQIITFMKYGRQNDAGIHFGNSSGTNALEGKDIAVIGTPYKNEESYKLAACCLGADVNRKEDRVPKRKRVQYKEYDFLITTYSERLLRIFQLYSIESELEQCVGRARLLRRDCTVYVFSAFPCEQAEIFIWDYLGQDMREGIPDSSLPLSGN